MEKRLEGTRNIYLTSGKDVLVDYYLLRSCVHMEEREATIYGIEAVKRVEEQVQEINAIPYITTDEEEIEYLLYKLIGGAVTPYTLGEILDEWVC